MSLVEYDDMVEALSADTAIQAFKVRVLLSRSRCRDDFLDAHVGDTIPEKRSVDSIAILEQKARR